jgi:hypothetical protein
MAPPLGGSLGLTLFIDAEASTSVPSSEKCSIDNDRVTRGWDSTAAGNLAAMLPSRSRSRSLEELKGSHTDYRCQRR